MGSVRHSMRLIGLVLVGLMGVSSAYAQSGALERIRKDGVIKLGYVAGAAPFSSRDERGEPQGYSVDLCRTVAEDIRVRLGIPRLETRWVVLTPQDRLDAVQSGRVDVECSTTTWTLSRHEKVDFSLITFVDGASVLTGASADIYRLDDFKDKRIAAIKGTTTFTVLTQALKNRSITATVVPVSDRGEGLKLLQTGKVEGFASDRVTLIELVVGQSGAGAYKLLGEDFSIEQYALALPRGDHDFRLAVNRTLAGLYRSGKIDQIYERWLGKLGKPSLLLSAVYFIQGISE
jgi:ABC-type amino acid transport substrate-binding protein